MRLTVVGNSGSYPGPHSSASCYLLEADYDERTWRVLLDLGNGALGALQRYADPLAVDAVLLSHLHADHCLDLCGYYVLRKYHPDGPQPRIPVWGPEGTASRMARAYDLPETPGMTEEFDFRTYPGGSFSLGPFTFLARRVNHPVTAYALRISVDDAVLVYSGDTAYCEPLVTQADGADVFLCEASFLDEADNPPDIHLTGLEAGAIATTAGARQLLLTHIPPWHDPAVVLGEAKESFVGDVRLAEVGTTYEV
ncbi:MBL fold metallo-hydrolase [Nocardioides mangrovicus]|uniref:MBL fold metallo-hydrolase n=1 Tax=Nocardioides mangrovicus TaxID=2478913 RepID=A0A3L8P583_9ACTN|nr:MBL fold metallo-hydrolase [Nocardioides mangrovicus]RLV49779.1 MBL fold metallo-hydrolase [Nocardioides mangrovicus]